MQINWLPDLIHAPSCDSAMWRSNYKTWIAECPEERKAFSEFPIQNIYACPQCGMVEEMPAGSMLPCKHGSPYYVRFGEHERAMVESAVQRWIDSGKLRRAQRTVVGITDRIERAFALIVNPPPGCIEHMVVGYPTERPQDRSIVSVTRVPVEVVSGHSTDTMEAAIEDWRKKMAAFVGDKKEQILWRKRPICSTEKDFATQQTHYQVACRLGVM